MPTLRRRWSRRDRVMVCLCLAAVPSPMGRLKSLLLSLQLGATRHQEPDYCSSSEALSNTSWMVARDHQIYEGTNQIERIVIEVAHSSSETSALRTTAHRRWPLAALVGYRDARRRRSWMVNHRNPHDS